MHHKQAVYRLTNSVFLLFITLFAVMSATSPALAQSQTVLASNLKTPNKIILTPAGNLLVAESGTAANTGRVSLVNPCGVQFALLDAMPSAPALPGNEPDGVTSVALRGRTLYVLLGEGDSLIAGPAPNTTIENPTPASPLLSSILVVELNNDLDRLRSGFTLPTADHAKLKNGSSITLQNAQGESATIKLLADFANAYPNPTPAFAGNMRTSHPFALTLDSNNLYVADAGINGVRKIDIATGTTTTLANLPPIANPLPFGPPVSEAVPDGIHLFGDQLLVTLLTGFPFPAGKAEVRRVNTSTGAQEPFITGLTSAIDVLTAKTRNGSDQFFVLEYTSNLLGNPLPTGRVLRFDTPTGTPTVIATGLVSPVGMARDPRSGDIFVTENSTGKIIQIYGNQFDIFLKDSSNGDSLRFSTSTGEYVFSSCRGESVTISGIAAVSRTGCQLKLQSPFISATLDQCSLSAPSRGRAVVKRTRVGPTYFIEGNNIAK